METKTIRGIVSSIEHYDNFSRIFINGKHFNWFYNNNAKREDIAKSIKQFYGIVASYEQKEGFPPNILAMNIAITEEAEFEDAMESSMTRAEEVQRMDKQLPPQMRKKMEEPICRMSVTTVQELTIPQQAVFKGLCEFYGRTKAQKTGKEILAEVREIT